MRIVIMGAGGVGGFFGAKLARAGSDVTLVARGAHLDAIRSAGLHVKSAIEGEWTARPTAVADVRGLPAADAVLFCVKGFDTEQALDAIRPVVGPDTPVLTLQNGIDGPEKIDAALGPGHALGGAAYIFATIESPGVIVHRFLGRIVLGELDGRVTARAERLRDALAGAGIPVELSREIRRVMWEKYLMICAQGGMTAVTRANTGTIRAVPETWRMYRTLLEELAAVGGKANAGLAPDVVDTLMRAAERLAPGTTSSLHHDLLAGRRLELETLHGQAVRLAERHGVVTPTLFSVYAALRPWLDGSENMGGLDGPPKPPELAHAPGDPARGSGAGPDRSTA